MGIVFCGHGSPPTSIWFRALSRKSRHNRARVKVVRFVRCVLRSPVLLLARPSNCMSRLAAPVRPSCRCGKIMASACSAKLLKGRHRLRAPSLDASHPCGHSDSLPITPNLTTPAPSFLHFAGSGRAPRGIAFARRGPARWRRSRSPVRCSSIPRRCGACSPSTCCTTTSRSSLFASRPAMKFADVRYAGRQTGAAVLDEVRPR